MKKGGGEKMACKGICCFFISFCLLVFLCAGVASASLSITAWSSSGGNTTNKDNPQDLMYLVTANDIITFSVTTNEPCNFTWQVNKEVKKNTITTTSDSFTFTVPSLNCSQDPSQCIWEIHVKAYNENGEAHQEWVISTLSEEEAPDIFDYFTDKKSQDRTETDPWGRPLPEWTNNFDSNLKQAMIFVKKGTESVDSWAPSNIFYGTWRFKYSLKSWAGTSIQFWPIFKWDVAKRGYMWEKYADAHRFSNIKRAGSEEEFSTNYDEMGRYDDGNWHEITIIHTPDGFFYEYMDGILDVYSQDNELTESEYIRVMMQTTSTDVLKYLDCIEVYEGKYLFPKKKAIYAEYIANYYGDNGEWVPIKRNGIIIFNKNTTLKEIASDINNPSLFTYDESTRTAICYTDLVLFDGAELVINNETLKFHCDYDGELYFSLKYGSVLRMNNSRITTTNSHYFVWNLQSSTTHLQPHSLLIYSKFGEYYTCDGVHGHTPYDPKGTLHEWLNPIGHYGRFIIHNSTINNCAHLFFDSPYELNIENTTFSNIYEIDIGNYSGVDELNSLAKEMRLTDKGNKSIYILIDDLNVYKFNLKNVVITNSYGKPINITFLTNAVRDKINVYNIDAENENIVVKKARAQNLGRGPAQSRCYSWLEYIPAETGFVNCRFKDIVVATDNASAVPKYYLDVKVIDEDGNPVHNAVVKVSNEVSEDYPPENMIVNKIWCGAAVASSPISCLFCQYRYLMGQILNETYTTATGHTPLPLEDPAHTIVIADYVKDINGTTDFTYTITASYNGKTASMSGLDIDETWYREDPEIPTKTVVCNIDTGSCWVESITMGTIEGNVTDKDTDSPIPDATVTANSYSTTTDAEGYYILTVPPGTYTVTASKEGYNTNTTTVQVSANQTVEVNFQLTKDTTPPEISDVTVSSVTFNSAVITWNTNEPATSIVKYGTSPGNYTYSKENSSFTTSHSITLTGLTPNTTYYFVVRSEDKAGNSNESSEYKFTTEGFTGNLTIVYVATDGSGNYNCDGSDDQVEINEAISYINSIGGGTVHLKAGTYVINDSINLCSNLTFEGEGVDETIIKIQDGSTKQNWATIVADGISSTVIRNLTINGNKYNIQALGTNSSICIYDSIEESKQNRSAQDFGINDDIDAIRIRNSHDITIDTIKMIDFWTDGVEFSHSSNSIVRNCSVIQASHEGLRAIYCENITFTNNYVYSSGTGNAGIRIYESSDCVVEDNYFNVYGFGILINPQGGVPCGNNIYRDNYIEGHYGLPAIALWPWDTEISNETFIRNIIARTDGTQEDYGHGIHLMTRGTASLKDIKMINNVIYDAIKSGIYVEDGASVSGIVAKNNIIVNCGEYGIYGPVSSSYNDVWNNSAGNYGGGASAGEGDISEDPLFASPPDDFHLKSQYGRWDPETKSWVKDDVTSPCIDAGVPFDEDPVYGDYRNEPMPNGGRINMGAYGNTREASKSFYQPLQIVSYSPSDLSPTQYVNSTYTFSVETNQPVTSTWLLDGNDQHHNAQSWTHTWSASDVGVHNVTYIGTNENGSVSLTWNVTVIEKRVVNHPPSLSPLKNQTGVVGVPWEYDISDLVYDPDGDPLTVTTDDEGNITVEGFVLHFLYSTPVYKKPVRVTVTDSGGLSDTETMFVTVTEKSVLYVNDVTASPNSSISVPVFITCNHTIIGIDFNISFNSSVISLINVTKGNLTSSWKDPVIKTYGAGRYRILIFDTISDAIGAGASGSVLILNFKVNGKPGDKTTIDISDVKFSDTDFNEIAGASVDGTVFVEYNNYISGKVLYACNGSHISGAIVTINGDNFTKTVYTDENGNYMIPDVPPGDYILSVSKERFMKNATVSIHVGEGDKITIDVMLYLKGDLNNNCVPAEMADVDMMLNAWKGEINANYIYDLNENGEPADVADVAMIWNAYRGEIQLLYDTGR